jgi:hypothetical protein
MIGHVILCLKMAAMLSSVDGHAVARWIEHGVVALVALKAARVLHAEGEGRDLPCAPLFTSRWWAWAGVR